MIIQVILTFMLMLLTVYAFYQRFRSTPVSWFIVGCCSVGLIFVWMPWLSTDFAHFLGVGRGADLIFYLFALLGMAAVFNLHLRLRSHMEAMTELARRIAILSAQAPKADKMTP